MSGVRPQPGIMDIALYVGGASHVEGVREVTKLSSNENPFGPPPAARDALARSAHDLHRYPNTDHASLRAAIGKVHGLDPDRIMCGVGSDEIISFLCYAYAGVGDEVIYTQHGFGMYKISARAAGAVPVCVPEKNRVVDPQAILDAVTDRTRLVFIANPANPTGTMLDLEVLAALADALPAHVLLVLDGAYAEYAEAYDGGVDVIDRRQNVFMTRTFSKLYGLGGLRVGWGYGPKDIIDVLNRLRGPFNLSGPALAAAEAAVLDRAFATRSASENAKGRAWLIDALAAVGVPCDPSHANFILARFKDAETAQACDAALKAEGILVRMVAGYDLPNCLRITIGDEAACRRVAHVVAAFMTAKQEGAA